MLHVLHVDRSELFRKVMKELVVRYGYSITSVATQAEALGMVADQPVDLIITAIELDDGSAETLIKSITKDLHKDIPAIIVTSTDSLELREKFFGLGVVDYILKSEINEERLRRYFEALSAEDELSRYIRELKFAVLDDSPLILKIVSHILTINGIEKIRQFSNAGELFASKETFDVYILDIVLPDMSGEQVVHRLRIHQKEAIIISMSRFSGEKSLTTILMAGADDYIHKPFDAAELMSRIRINARAFKMRKRLEYLAVTDGLTGLFNHRHSFELLEKEMARSRRYKHPLSILLIDIDDFKRVNDEFGHRAGDKVLEELGTCLHSLLRASDIAGRYGGEEFIIILPETTLNNAAKVAEKIRSTLAAKSFYEINKPLTVSIGAVEFRDGETAEALVNRVDELMYRAKVNGKNQVETEHI
ncbi:MAG TPA: diguanylate cyclase [Spirochaetales bacterium]|nr:diguanylate cyclase [Spirochaetales bacterium]